MNTNLFLRCCFLTLCGGVTLCAALPFPEAETDVWVAAGQSNMQGYGVITHEYQANPAVRVYDLSDQWVPAVPPTHRIFGATAPIFKTLIFQMNPAMTEEGWKGSQAQDRRKPLGGVGPDLAFVEALATATGRKIVLVPCALGGTTLAQWCSALKDRGTESLYGALLDRVAKVGGRLRGIIWYQGESQAGKPETVGSYEADFLDLVDSLRRDLNAPDLPILTVQIGRFMLQNRENEGGWKTVQDKQRTVVRQRKNLWVVPALDLPLDDLIHVSEGGQQRLGHRLAEVALSQVYGLADRGHPLELESWRLEPEKDMFHRCLRLSFSGVTGRLRAGDRPAGFVLDSDDPKHDGPMVNKVEFDPADPAAVLVWYTKPIKEPVRLSYGLGYDVYANLVDERDMAVPAFGPVLIEPAK